MRSMLQHACWILTVCFCVCVAVARLYRLPCDNASEVALESNTSYVADCRLDAKEHAMYRTEFLCPLFAKIRNVSIVSDGLPVGFRNCFYVDLHEVSIVLSNFVLAGAWIDEYTLINANDASNTSIELSNITMDIANATSGSNQQRLKLDNFVFIDERFFNVTVVVRHCHVATRSYGIYFFSYTNYENVRLMVFQSTILSSGSMAVRINWPQVQFDNMIIVIRDVVMQGQLLGFVDQRPPAAQNLSITIHNVTVETVGVPAIAVGSGGGYVFLQLHISDVVLTSWNATTASAVLCHVSGNGFMLYSSVTVFNVSVRSALAAASPPSSAQTTMQVIVGIQTHLALHSSISVAGVVVNSTSLRRTAATSLIYLAVRAQNDSSVRLACSTLQFHAPVNSSIAITLLNVTSQVSNVSRVRSVAAEVDNVTVHLITASSAVATTMMHVQRSQNVSLALGSTVLSCDCFASPVDMILRAVGVQVAAGMASSAVKIETPSIRLESRAGSPAGSISAVTGFESTDSVSDSIVVVAAPASGVLRKEDINNASVASMLFVTGVWSNVTAEVVGTQTSELPSSPFPLCSLMPSQAPRVLHTIVACGVVCSFTHRSALSVEGLAGVSMIVGPSPWNRSAPLPSVTISDASLIFSHVSFFPSTASLMQGSRFLLLRNVVINMSLSVLMFGQNWVSILPPLSSRTAEHFLINGSYSDVSVSAQCVLRVHVQHLGGVRQQQTCLGSQPLSPTDVYPTPLSDSSISFRTFRSASCAFDTSSTSTASSSPSRQTPSVNDTGTDSITQATRTLAATHTHTVSPQSSISLSRSVDVCPTPTLREISAVALASFSGSSGGLFHVVLAMSAPFADTAVSWGSTWALLAPVPVTNWTRINASAVAVTLHLLVDPQQAVVLTVAQTLTLTATLRVAACTHPGDTAPTLNYTVAASTTITLAPIAALPAVVTAVLEATTAVAGIAGGLLVGGSSAVSLQQSMLLLDLSVCQFSLSAPMSVADSPTQLCFGARLNSCVRGAVIGNVAVCAAFVVALLLLGWWLEGSWRTTLGAVRRNVALPGMLILPYLLLLQPTAAASITLLRHRQDESDVWIGAFGVVACLLVFLFFPLRVLPNFAHAAVPVDLSSKSRLMQWIAPQYEWVPIRTESDYTSLSAQRADGSAATAAPWVPELAATDRGQKFATFTSSYIVLFDAYSPGRHWFFVVEMLNAGINGIIGGIKPISDVGCQGLAYGMLAVTLVGVLLAVLKPYNSRIGTVSYIVQSASGALCALFVVLQDQDAAEAMALVAFICSIAFAVIGIWAKGKTEVRRIIALIKQRWNRFVPAAFLISNVDEPAVEGNEIGAAVEEELQCLSEYSDMSAPVATSRCRRARRNSFAAYCELNELLQAAQEETNGCMSFISQRRVLVFLVTEASRMRSVAGREQDLRLTQSNKYCI